LRNAAWTFSNHVTHGSGIAQCKLEHIKLFLHHIICKEPWDHAWSVSVVKISFCPVGSVPYNVDLVFRAFAGLFTMLAACGRLDEKFIITVFFFHCLCSRNTFFSILLHDLCVTGYVIPRLSSFTHYLSQMMPICFYTYKGDDSWTFFMWTYMLLFGVINYLIIICLTLISKYMEILRIEIPFL
jgi:hypothetical protein